jgi:hypothetical protein
MSLKNENMREDVVSEQTAVPGYEAPRVEAVLTPEDVEREALYGGITRV